MENKVAIFKEEAPKYKLFMQWIEQTHLFSVIKAHAGTGLIIESLPDTMRLKLDGTSKIEKAEDLPIELIQQFYINSPFYTRNNEGL